MNWSATKKYIRFIVILLISEYGFGQDSVITIATRERVNQYRAGWMKITPKFVKAQFAGSMGLISVGVGWNYGRKNQWETDMLMGYLPKFNTNKHKVTFTLKQNYIPWKWKLNKTFSVDPLTCGLYANSVIGDEFWVSEPDKYGNNYYSFSTKIRFNIFVGQRLTYQLKNTKALFDTVTFFYEISTSDLYIVSAFINKYLKPADYLGASVGLKWQIF